MVIFKTYSIDDLLNKKIELDIPTVNQVFGDNKIDIFNKYGKKAIVTDFAILLGGYVSNYNHNSKDNSLESRTGSWWTKNKCCEDSIFGSWWKKSQFQDKAIYDVSSNGLDGWDYYTEDTVGIRPITKLHSILKAYSFGYEINELEYGEYPQWIVSKDKHYELEREYSNGNLKTTGKNYTMDSVATNSSIREFRKRTFIEYEYKGNKYIRFVGDINNNDEILSNGRIIQSGNVYWIKVEPIVWLVDEKSGIAIKKHILASGIQFDNQKEYKGDFENTNIYKYMNTYMIKDMFDNIDINRTNEEEVSDKEFTSIDNKMKDIKKRIRRLQESK